MFVCLLGFLLRYMFELRPLSLGRCGTWPVRRSSAHFSARQPWHSATLRRSILSDSGRCGTRLLRRLAADRLLWLSRSAVFVRCLLVRFRTPRAPPALVLGYRGARGLRRPIAWRRVTTALTGFRSGRSDTWQPWRLAALRLNWLAYISQPFLGGIFLSISFVCLFLLFLFHHYVTWS